MSPWIPVGLPHVHRHRLNPRTAGRPEELEEGLQGQAVPAPCHPEHPLAPGIHNHGRVAVAFLDRELVDRQEVDAGEGLAPDRSQRAKEGAIVDLLDDVPAHATLGSHLLQGKNAGQPGDLFSEPGRDPLMLVEPGHRFDGGPTSRAGDAGARKPVACSRSIASPSSSATASRASCPPFSACSRQYREQYDPNLSVEDREVAHASFRDVMHLDDPLAAPAAAFRIGRHRPQVKRHGRDRRRADVSAIDALDLKPFPAPESPFPLLRIHGHPPMAQECQLPRKYRKNLKSCGA